MSPDGARHDRRRVAQGLVGRGDRQGRRRASRPIQAEYGVGAIGGISSSRCTNEEVYVVQKMVRAAFGNNNVDTCARVCHSPTGYGLKQTLGTSAGTQDFRSVDQADVILLIGANPTDAHPVFASRMKRRLREGTRADRGRPAPDRPGPQPPRRGGVPPAPCCPVPTSPSSTRWRTSSSPKGCTTRSSCASAARTPTSTSPSSPTRATPPRPWPRRPGSTPSRSAPRPASSPARATARSTTGSASPSTPRARRW